MTEPYESTKLETREVSLVRERGKEDWTYMERGSATPMAYESWTRTRSARPAAMRDLAIQRLAGDQESDLPDVWDEC